MKTVAIVQSSYLPWKGYFDLIASVDEFVFYDCVQYTRRDWRNRNQIKTAHGKAWLTVPVCYADRSTPIDSIRVADKDVLRKHWQSILGSYARCSGAPWAISMLEPAFARDAPDSLSALNVEMTTRIAAILGISTRLSQWTDHAIMSLERNERLAEICVRRGATRYVSGPSAREYIEPSVFASRGIDLEFFSYTGYPEYAQPYPPFDHHVSIVDLLFSAGEESPAFVVPARPVEAT